MRFLSIALVVSFFGFGSLLAQTIEELEAKLPSLTDTARVTVLLKICVKAASQDTTKAMNYAREALSISQRLKYPYGEAQAYRRFGMVYYFSNNHAKFVNALEKSNEISMQNSLWSILAENYNNLAGGYASIQGNQILALENYLKAYEIYDKHLPNGKKYVPMMGIGISYQNQSQYDKALKYIRDALPLIDAAHDDRNKAVAYENIGSIYINKKDFVNAKIAYDSALMLFKATNGIGGQMYTLAGLANIAREMGDLATALQLGKRALEFSKNYSTPDKARIIGLESLGKTLLVQKKYNEAKTYLEEALAIAIKIKASEYTKDISEHLAKVSAGMKDYKKAYEYEIQFKIYADSDLNKEMTSQLSEVRTRFETEKKEAEIELLKRDKQITQFYFITAVAAMLGLIAIGYLTLTRQRYKNKKDRELASVQHQALTDKKALVDFELKNKELEEAKLRDALEFKNKELTTYTLNLIQKNEALENIKQQVDEMRLLPDQQLRPKLASLINTVNFSLNLDRDWENFKQHFEGVHQGFFDKLVKEYPDLTGNDLKLCALMKLNMDTKEIATIIDISPESVKVARHRLRKKMNLATEQNLSSYLAAFGESRD